MVTRKGQGPKGSSFFHQWWLATGFSFLKCSSILQSQHKQVSITKEKVWSISALGTKAYAAPKIKNKHRNKTIADVEKKNAALAECVADYGVIADAYSVGWILQVILTGVPLNSTISVSINRTLGALKCTEHLINYSTIQILQQFTLL
jgi:hypothetical protein